MEWGLALTATASIVGALVAAISAIRAKRLENEAARWRDLENRIAHRKFETYEPMIDLLRRMIDPETGQALRDDTRALREEMSKFHAWASIFASDEAVTMFRNFMQAAFPTAPAMILMRLYAEFVLAARRDMGHPDTEITPETFLSMRLTDFYANSDVVEAAQLDFATLCGRHGWTPPWERG